MCRGLIFSKSDGNLAIAFDILLMRLAVLLFRAEKDKLAPGTGMLVERAREMGNTVSLLHEEKLQIRYGNGDPIYHDGEPLREYDAIIVRPGIKKDPSIHAAIIREIEMTGQLVINGYLGVHRAKNKIRTLQVLDHHGLAIPKTAVVYGVEEAERAAEIFTFPVIVKAAYGAGGTGIFIAETKRSLQPIMEFLLDRQPDNDPIKIQEYIRESKGKDIRVFVVGDSIAATMERTAKRDDFRSNYNKGGSVAAVDITEEEAELSIKATKKVGLDFSGVDILRTNNGPVIIEVNSYPGLKGITKATDEDVAGKIVNYVKQRVAEKKGEDVDQNTGQETEAVSAKKSRRDTDKEEDSGSGQEA